MKSKIKRRMLALVLCMVIVLSNSSFIFASGGGGEVVSQEDGQQTQDSQNGEDASGIAAQAETKAADATPTPTSDATPEPTPTATPEPTPTAAPEPTPTAAPEPTPTTTPEPTPAETSEPTTTPEPTTEPQVTEQPTTQPSGENDPAPSPTAGPENDGQTTPADPENGNGQNGNGGSGIGTALVPTETPAKSNEAVELKKEFKDSNGKVTATVTAKIPAGAFEADASEITMEVKTPKQADVKHLTKMMEESLPEHHMLGDYILYDIQFKVNGTAAEARQPIVITFEGNGISVKDVKRANVFRFDAADPEVEGDKDELVAITQKSDMLEYLQNSGQSTENIDDYDLSEISLKEDGTSDKIQMEGRTSTIYGCYVVYEPVQVLTYEDEQVVVTVSAQENGVIPANAELKVVPITAEDAETKEQYAEVEKKLQEKAEEEAYDIAGFLAYDITFVDPDGNETEPGGEVKVSIDYKEAAIPESISEEDAANTEVTVLHLEEDEKGEVKEVVDMAQDEKVDVLATTEESKIEKAEVRTENFSTFTITWYTYSMLYVSIVDNLASSIGYDQSISLVDINGIQDRTGVFVEKLAGEYEIGESYTFSYAVISSQEIKNAASLSKADRIAKIRYWKREWNYQKENSSNWKSIEEDDYIYLVYNTLSTGIETIETVDSIADGITLNLFDYDESKGINYGKDFKFTNGGVNEADINRYHKGTGNNAVFDGIFKRNMAKTQDGVYTFPVFSDPYNNGDDAAYLFSTQTVNGKDVYANVNYLFKKNSDGYYVYDSSENYAYYNESQKRFVVYNVPAAPNGDADCYMKGNFFPFNTLASNSSVKDRNTGLRNFETGSGSTTKNTHFGMTMSASFSQPAKGKINDKNMVFKFTGDDDVWVFIDGVLVLDIGGVHDALDGSIDFATGKVTVTGQTDTTLKALFNAAGRNVETGFTGDTFSDYTEHSINFYYLERGEGASNCKLEFNIQTIPKNRIIVGKQITNANADVYSDVEFSFQLEVDEDGGDNFQVVNSQKVNVYDASGNYLRECTVDGEGIFKLKHGERAYFDGYPVTAKYRVKELGVDSDQYDNVTINDTEYVLTETENANGTKDWQTDNLSLSQNHLVIFRNQVTVGNQRELQITKKISNGTSEDLFRLQVFFGDEALEENGEPYSGVYYVDDDGDGENEKHTATDGIVSIKNNQTVSITGIPSGTSFKVVEIDLDQTGYLSPTFTVKEGTASEIEVDGMASGKIILGADAEVTVTNHKISSASMLTHNKTAVVEDYNERVYQINLSAGAIGNTPGTKGEDASIVLVLDASSSLLDEAFDQLKTAAKSFIDTAAGKSSGEYSGDIEVAVVWYNGTQGSDTVNKCTSSSGFKSVKDSNSVAQLKNHITDKRKSGGTPMGDGLHAAQNLLASAKYSNRYVLLFTDGRPGYNGSNLDCMVANDAYNRASDLKNSGVIIYTVGYGNDLDEDFKWQRGHSSTSIEDHPRNHNLQTKGSEFLENYIASSGCAIVTYDINDLENIFKDIAGSIGSNVTIATKEIKDIVDQRFNLLVKAEQTETDEIVWRDQSGNGYRFAKNGDKILDKDGNEGIVTYNSNTKSYTITWSNISIANVEDGGWAASFYIKAKEDFIGGNVVPTNGDDSGIYFPDEDSLKFPMPTVNVKLLKLQSENKEVTYFKGESVNPSGFIQELLNTAEIVELVSENGETITIPISTIINTLSQDQLNSLVSGTPVTVPYKYGTTEDVVGSFHLSFEGSNKTEHELVNVGASVESYTLKIEYIAISQEDRNASVKGWQRPVGSSVASESTAPQYTVHVVAGSITINKTVSVDDLKKILAVSNEITFIFEVIKEGSDTGEEVTISFNPSDLENIGSDKEITKTSTVLSNLGQGIYNVRESDVDGFEAEDVKAAGKTDSEYPIKTFVVNSDELTADLYLGLSSKDSDSDNDEYLTWRDGEVTFTNSKIDKNWQIVKVSESSHAIKLGGAEFELVNTSDSEKKYLGYSDEVTGIVSWKQDDEEVSKLEKGTYTLKETKAPKGYLRSEITWTVVITASGALKSITADDQSSIKMTTGSDGTVSYFYENTAVYDLPSAGGSGIFWYLMSGTLFMMAASFILYRMKRKEVLGK